MDPLSAECTSSGSFLSCCIIFLLWSALRQSQWAQTKCRRAGSLCAVFLVRFGLKYAFFSSENSLAAPQTSADST